MAQGVGAGAAFLIYANGSLCGTVAHKTGLESSEFRTETVAMSLGLSALTALKDCHSYSSIRIFIDCQCLIATLSRGLARKSDSVCNSIWFQLSSIRRISSVHVQWIPRRARRSSMPATYGMHTQPHMALWRVRPIRSVTGNWAVPEAITRPTLNSE